MPVNPGDRYPQPTVGERAVAGSIAFFHPILDALVLMIAVILALQGLTLPALAVAFLAGRMGAR